jgi:hypothetical protein
MLMPNTLTETLTGGEGDWLLTIPANTMLIGAIGKVDAFVDALMPGLNSPVVHWRPAEHQPLPPLTSGTLILHQVEAIPPERQRWFLARLTALDHRVRVISTSDKPVWPLVERGAFLAALYYRLNVLLMDLTRTPAGI